MNIYEYDVPFDKSAPFHSGVLPYLEAVRFQIRDDATPRTGLELRCTREALGLSAHDFATYTSIGLRTIQRWEQHRSETIPPSRRISHPRPRGAHRTMGSRSSRGFTRRGQTRRVA